jgi:hypothetical protein
VIPLVDLEISPIFFQKASDAFSQRNARFLNSVLENQATFAPSDEKTP